MNKQGFNYNDCLGVTFGLGVFESADKTPSDGGKTPSDGGNRQMVFESSDDYGDAQVRSAAMSAVLAWVEDGEFGYGTLDGFVTGIADLDDDENLDDDEIGYYNDIWNEVANAMISLGASSANVEEFLDDEDDDAGNRLGEYLAGIMDNMPSSDNEILSTFAVGADGAVFECSAGIHEMDDAILEAAYKKTRVVRDGKVVIKKKRISGKVRLSAKQKAALKKARRRANSAAAKLKRKRSQKLRKKRGL